MPPGIRCGWTQDVRIFTHLGEKCVNLQPDRQTLRADYCTLGDAVWLWLVRLLRTLVRSRCFASRLSVPRGFCSGRRRCNINPSRNIAMSLPTTWVASAWRGAALLSRERAMATEEASFRMLQQKGPGGQPSPGGGGWLTMCRSASRAYEHTCGMPRVKRPGAGAPARTACPGGRQRSRE